MVCGCGNGWGTRKGLGGWGGGGWGGSSLPCRASLLVLTWLDFAPDDLSSQTLQPCHAEVLRKLQRKLCRLVSKMQGCAPLFCFVCLFVCLKALKLNTSLRYFTAEGVSCCTFL